MNFRLIPMSGLLLVLCCRLPAASITGTFSIDGSITATLNTISWGDNLGSTDNLFVVGGAHPTGSWSTMALGSEGNVQDLNLISEPVGGSFPGFNFPDWMTFPGPGPQSTIGIDLQYIYQGNDGQAECGASPAPGQSCTPLDAGGTPGPFDLVNSPSGTTSTATFTFLGLAVDSSGILSDSQIIGQYSVNFSTPYQTVLQDLVNHGAVTETYAATFTTFTPEPASLEFIGIGLAWIAAGMAIRRFRPSSR